MGQGNWQVGILRHPRALTLEEVTRCQKYANAKAPQTRKHDYCGLLAPDMLRCPIGGGPRRYGVLNIRASNQAVRTHYNIPHRGSDGTFLFRIHHRGFSVSSPTLSAEERRRTRTNSQRVVTR